MSKLICAVYHDIPSATISITEHNTTKSMVGPWPLAPHHDYLQCIYISCILMHRDQNRGVTFPSPLNSTVLSALQNLNKMLHRYPLSVSQNWIPLLGMIQHWAWNLNGEKDAPASDSPGRNKYDLLVLIFHLQYAWIQNIVLNISIFSMVVMFSSYWL